MAAYQRVHGVDHPDTLTANHLLADLYADSGRLSDAIKIASECLLSSRRELGADHPQTLAILTNLAIYHRRSGRDSDALNLLEHSFTEKLRVLHASDQHLYVAASQLADCQTDLGRGADATATADRYLRHIVGKDRVDPGWIFVLLSVRNKHLASHSDAAGCRATAELAEQSNPILAEDKYNTACFFAIAAVLYAKADQQAEAVVDADRAMGWLSKAVAAMYLDRAHMEKDPNLDPLRHRADFRALLNTLPDPAPPPRPAG